MNARGLFLLLIIAGTLQGQNQFLSENSFLGAETQLLVDQWNISTPRPDFHSSMRPYLSKSYLSTPDSAPVLLLPQIRGRLFSLTSSKKKNSYSSDVLPILDLEPGLDILTKRLIFSGFAGAQAQFHLNSNFTAAFSFFGGSLTFPFFIDTSLRTGGLIPEYGQAYGKQSANYPFSDYRGYLSFTTRKRVFNLQVGRGKQFVGDGYRSILLSDFSPAYPYFKITANVWKLQYSVWYAWMYNVYNAAGFKDKYSNKFGTFHYLSYNVSKAIQVGLFENVIWRGSDSTQRRSFDVNYLNPVIFYRPQEYSIGSPDNSYLGLNLHIKLFRKVKVYAQLGLDEFYLKEIRARRGWWANKQAWQFGVKYINAFGLEGLSLQMEYNQARPYTFSHGLPEQNYAHYGIPLAHPLGANFKELQTLFSLKKGRYTLSWQGMYAIVGKDTSITGANMGQNIFRSYVDRPYEYGHYTTQGVRTLILQSHLKFAFYLVPALNMRLELGYIQRSERNARDYALENPYFYLGFKTSFWNIYRDF